jgi:hypothetical protein
VEFALVDLESDDEEHFVTGVVEEFRQYFMGIIQDSIYLWKYVPRISDRVE